MSATVDLAAEFAAACAALKPEARALAIAAGVPQALIDDWPLLGAARVIVERGLDQPYDEGRVMFITPVRVGPDDGVEQPNPMAAVFAGDIVDLVAWHPGAPERWALRRGAAQVLGAVEAQIAGPEPVPIRRSPLAWLRAGGDGLCLLTRDPAEAQRVLGWCWALAAEDLDHARALRRTVDRPYPPKPIYVRSPKAKVES